MPLPDETPTPKGSRKSIGGRRCSIGGAPGNSTSNTPRTPFLDVPENNDDAERRQRQLSRLQQLQNSRQIGSPVNNERRKSIASLEPRLTGQQLAQHYAKCIQLSAENKISAKNAFNLQLIDYMTEMLKSKDSDMNNFQVASCTLDASTKIYAYRVDCIHTDTMRMAGGLGRTQQEKQGEGDPADPSQPMNPAKRKRNKKTATIETNPNSLSLSSLELEFMVDPLFKKISSQFDEGRAGGGLFLNSLSLKDDCCEMLLDSQAVLGDSASVEVQKDNVTIPAIQSLDGVVICPSFSTFHFGNWRVDDEESISEEKMKEANNETHAFDINAIPEPLDDLMDDPVDFGACDDDGDVADEFDSMAGNDGGNCTAMTVGVAGQHYKSVIVPTMETMHLKEHLASMPLEYSYFDAKVISAWAGPSHWKLKPAIKDRLVSTQTNKDEKPSKKKEAYEHNYTDITEKLETIEQHFTVTKRMTKLSNNTIKTWSENNTTLPFDLHFDPHDFAKLYGRSDVVVRRHYADNQSLVETINDSIHDFDNNLDDNQDYAAGGPDDMDMSGNNHDLTGIFSQTVLPPPSQQLQGEFLGDNLVVAPNRVAKLNIGYARTAKRMDMKKLKTTLWNMLTDIPDDQKENDQNGANGTGKNTNENEEKLEMGKNASIPFSAVFKSLPNNLNIVMAENLSCPLAFIALLHLCNERNLALNPIGIMEDFSIRQG